MNLRKNISWNVAEVVVTSLGLFLLYKIIIASVGVSGVGIWSLVMAATSIARVADVGAAAGLGRYIALADREGPQARTAIDYIETAWLLNFLLYLTLGLLLYWPAYMGLGLLPDPAVIREARQLLPFAIGSFVLMNLTAVVNSALLGLGKSYQKSALSMLAAIGQIGVAVFAIRSFGLRGVALAQMAQNLFICIVGWLLTTRAASGRVDLRLPWRLRMQPLRELLGFGLRLQAVNLATFLHEPAVKLAFSVVGGVHALGLFEMASRVVLQARQLLVTPSQNLTPLFARAVAENDPALRDLYQRAVTLIMLVAVTGFGILALGAPLLSKLWLGRVDGIFSLTLAVLCFAWLFNVVSVPAYLLGVGSGVVRWNLLGSAVTTVFGPVFGIFLGIMFGPLGVTTGAAIGIASGALLISVQNCRAQRLRVLPEFPVMTRELLASISQIRRVG
ncbi:oligosaccharide flippase family protein [Phenylobacterium deserti]|uniref:oligosaccharide flippase family protein n=1 Tax=Phenylobacterium deserti TaxID=1914756 RepID=UPI001403D44C|nr:oligosaccharide flippase family protein [Phenylobacterium deserti]